MLLTAAPAASAVLNSGKLIIIVGALPPTTIEQEAKLLNLLLELARAELATNVG